MKINAYLIASLLKTENMCLSEPLRLVTMWIRHHQSHVTAEVRFPCGSGTLTPQMIIELWK